MSEQEITDIGNAITAAQETGNTDRARLIWDEFEAVATDLDLQAYDRIHLQ